MELTFFAAIRIYRKCKFRHFADSPKSVEVDPIDGYTDGFIANLTLHDHDGIITRPCVPTTDIRIKYIFANILDNSFQRKIRIVQQIEFALTPHMKVCDDHSSQLRLQSLHWPHLHLTPYTMLINEI